MASVTKTEDGSFLVMSRSGSAVLLDQKDMSQIVEQYARLQEHEQAEFVVCEDMTGVSDSMLFDSNTVIASLSAEHGSKEAWIEVRGEVDVDFNGETYHTYSEFPQGLKDLIAKDARWGNDERVYVSNNNWFELFYASDGKIAHDVNDVVCVENATPKQLYELLASAVNKAEEKAVVPSTYESYLGIIKEQDKVVDKTGKATTSKAKKTPDLERD